MYQTALKQRQFYIEQFGIHRWSMGDYYKILLSIALFWFMPPEPVVCSVCGSVACVGWMTTSDNKTYCAVACVKCTNASTFIESIKNSHTRTKRQAIKLWNDYNHGMVCDIRKD